MPSPTARLALTFVVGLTAGGCERVEVLFDREPDLTPHERYAAALGSAGLAETALGLSWLQEADAVLRDAPRIETPYRETGYIPADRVVAMAYRVALRRGQSLLVDVELEAEPPLQLFVDLFREAETRPDEPTDFRRLVSADSGTLRIQFEPARDGDYLVRVQPELLRSASYTVTLEIAAALAFPVEGFDSGAIRSGFGVDRDAGRRSHQGVDIFAPRGTPAVAAVDGRISRVRNRGLGGKYVWIRDSERQLSLYYAHLDEQLVREGQSVQVGDTIGLVGNTGNARTTPPHLHFGVYRRGEGAINPYDWIHQPPGDPPALRVDTELLGGMARTRDDGILRSAAGRSSAEIATLGAGTPLRLEAGAGRWYRVRLPDGSSGFVIGSLVESAEEPLGRQVADADAGLRERPDPVAVASDTVRAGDEVPVYGRFGDYLLVRGRAGRSGWVEDQQDQRRP